MSTNPKGIRDDSQWQNMEYQLGVDAHGVTLGHVPTHQPAL